MLAISQQPPCNNNNDNSSLQPWSSVNGIGLGFKGLGFDSSNGTNFCCQDMLVDGVHSKITVGVKTYWDVKIVTPNGMYLAGS